MEARSSFMLRTKAEIPDKHRDLYTWVEPLEKLIKQNLCAEASGHDFYHHVRVLNLCLSIASKEDLDLEVLIAAALLHDIARPEERILDKPSDYHISRGVEIAEKLLIEVKFPTAKKALVERCITEHEADGSDRKEVQILQDADKLDAMGAIGIARCFTYGGKINRPIWLPNYTVENWRPGIANSSSIAHLYARILNLVNKMNTKRGKKIAKARFQFMLQFINQLSREWEGKL